MTDLDDLDLHLAGEGRHERLYERLGAHCLDEGGVLVAYSTAAGQYAQDGAGDLSPYARALIDALREPGIEMSKVFRRVSANVEAATKGTQVPTVIGNWPAEDLYVSRK